MGIKDSIMSVYGKCPRCGSDGVSRERRPNGNDRCKNSCVYPSREAVFPASELAARFHEAYERLAPSFGYETRDDTKNFNPNSKNGKLMVAVCGEILKQNGEKKP